jgi:hypothetical protein
MLAASGLGVPLGAAADGAGGVGRVKNVTGQAFIERGQVTLPAAAKGVLEEHDVWSPARTGLWEWCSRTTASCQWGANTRLALSAFQFRPAEEKGSFVARIVKGKVVHSPASSPNWTGRPCGFETPTTVCGVRGTHFAIDVREEER